MVSVVRAQKRMCSTIQPVYITYVVTDPAVYMYFMLKFSYYHYLFFKCFLLINYLRSRSDQMIQKKEIVLSLIKS